MAGHDPNDETSQTIPRRLPADELTHDDQQVAPVGPPRDEQASLRPREGGSLLALNRRQPPAQLAPPVADALEPDRILELPPRRPAPPRESQAESQPADDTGGTEATPTAPTTARVTRLLPSALRADRRLRAMPASPPAERNSRHMTSLREAAQPYIARLASRRGATPSSPQEAAGATAPADALDPSVCSHCHGAGFVRDDVPVGHADFGKAVLCECKARQDAIRDADRRRSELQRLSGLDAFIDKTFDTFRVYIPEVREAFDVAREYARNPTGWLVLSGDYGAGKTHLAAAIANYQAREGGGICFAFVPDLLDHLRATFAPNSEVRYDERFDVIRESFMLVLDDLGSENGTGWATEKLFQIIDHRYNSRTPTVITTNERLFSHLDGRIRSRLSDHSFVRWVSINVPDYRNPGRRRGSLPPHGSSSRTRKEGR